MWEEFEVLDEDLSGFKFVDDGVKPDEREWTAAWTRMHTQSALVDASFHNTSHDWLISEEDGTYDRDRWESWLQGQNEPRSNENYLSIAISQLAYFPGIGRNSAFPAGLKYVSLPEDGFRDVLSWMKIHPSFLGAVRESGPVATRTKTQAGGRECVVYLLRLSNAAPNQSAMAITFLPGTTTPGTQETGCRINALILGYSRRDVSLFEKTLRQRRRDIFQPRTLIMAFLEVEKQRRFAEVRLRRSGLLKILQNTGSAGEMLAEMASRPDRHRDVDDNVGLYVNVSNLVVDALQPWRRQILSLEGQVGDEDPRLAMELQQLALQYEHRLSRCDRILQGASLAYQMETTYLSRNDALTAIADGKRVKAIALLTMIFLPATFTAALMAVPQIERAIDAQKVFGDAAWIWYLVLSLSFTGFVLVVYLTWGCTSICRKRPAKPSQDGNVV